MPAVDVFLWCPERVLENRLPGHRQRMLWRLGFAGPWDILTQKQPVCLWGQSCESLGWCHIARLSNRLSPSQWRDKLPAASVQRHPWDIFQDSPDGRWCNNVSWSHIGFCLVSRIFKIPDEASIDHAFSDLVYAAGQCNRSITGWVSMVLVWFGDQNHFCCSPLMREIPRDPNLV